MVKEHENTLTTHPRPNSIIIEAIKAMIDNVNPTFDAMRIW